MKASISVSVALAFSLANHAQAQCSNNRVSDLVATLAGNLVCAYKSDPTDPNDRWSEVHAGSGTSGTLREWARGASDPVDPTHDVGTWTITGDGTPAATITYAYTGDGSYDYTLYANGGGSYSLCGTPGTATIKQIIGSPTGSNPCGWSD